ncbi:ankyrin repeat-containing domain protein [Diaporthe sp. PMI_573]|nr:ankyrin repeat-containing domain protein [Diaporthaceae sp. PMI_573]
MAAAVITDQGPNEELLPGPSAPSNEPTSVPTGEINEPGSVQVKPPDPQHASVSRLTVSNQGQRASKRRRPVIAVPGETLFVAARAGDKEIFLQILQTGAKITEVEADGTTVLQAAAEANSLDVVLSLLFFGADPNLGGGRTRSPLLAATDRQHAQVVAALLEAEADPSAFYPEAAPWLKSAFHSALSHRNSGILSMLLGAGADLKKVPGLLHHACSTGTLDSVKQLLATDLDINGLCDNWTFSATALQVSVFSNRPDIVTLLLDHKADPNIASPTTVPWQRSPLFAAVHAKNPEILSTLLSMGPNVNAIPGLLHYACSIGTLDSVKQLLNTDLDINALFDNGTFAATALQASVSNTRSDIVRFLLDHKADPNVTSPTSVPWQRSPLFAAAYAKNPEILSMLLAANADPKGVPGLLPYVAENSGLEFVKIMVEEGEADINSVHEKLGTALQVFAANGQRDALVYLLDLGAVDIDGSALNAAIANRHQHCTVELIS